MLLCTFLILYDNNVYPVLYLIGEEEISPDTFSQTKIRSHDVLNRSWELYPWATFLFSSFLSLSIAAPRARSRWKWPRSAPSCCDNQLLLLLARRVRRRPPRPPPKGAWQQHQPPPRPQIISQSQPTQLLLLQIQIQGRENKKKKDIFF